MRVTVTEHDRVVEHWCCDICLSCLSIQPVDIINVVTDLRRELQLHKTQSVNLSDFEMRDLQDLASLERCERSSTRYDAIERDRVSAIT